MLKYLFAVEFTDGSNYFQNHDDVSALDNKRSCFYDVLQEVEKGKKIRCFYLKTGEDFDLQTVGVNLIDGSFDVNGVSFLMHSDETLKDFRIIFYREHTHKFNQRDGIELGHDIVYCIGWQTDDAKGKNVQRIMRIS